jgi:hypothetical protein
LSRNANASRNRAGRLAHKLRRRLDLRAWLQRHGRELHRWWPARLSNPIFVIGAPRSGTTILGRILGQAPELLYLNEPRYIWTALDPALDAWAYRYPVEQGRMSWSATDATPDQRRRLSQWLALERFAAGKRLLVEKMPENSFRAGWLSALFPQARFIHIIRDGRDAALSLEAALARWFPPGHWESSRHYGFFAEYAAARLDLAPRLAAIPAAGRNYPRCLLAWLCYLLAAREAGATLGPARYLELRYEALIQDPEAALAPLFRFLGAETPPVVRQYAHQTLHPDSLGKADPDPALTEAIAGDMLRELGYLYHAPTYAG